MAKHRLKLLVLLMVFSVAPASAGSRTATAVAAYDDIECPYERARLAAAAAESAEPTTITLTQAMPRIGPGSAVLAP